jgi:lipoyl(octanoyl) transferase
MWFDILSSISKGDLPMLLYDISNHTDISTRTELSVNICDYGMLIYSDAMSVLQSSLEKRSKNLVPDTLLLLEHPPTYTLGLCGKIDHLLIPEFELKNRNIEIHRTDRGGDITFHGPGQLVGYPVLDLKTKKLDLRQYVKKLERVIIQAISLFNVTAHSSKGFPGVWVHNEKVAAIGVKINAAGISSHGFAINVNTDLAFFQNIIPCGLADKKVTSVAEITGYAIDMGKMKKSVAEAFVSEFAK